MKKISIISLLFLAACGTSAIKVTDGNENFVRLTTMGLTTPDKYTIVATEYCAKYGKKAVYKESPYSTVMIYDCVKEK